MEMRIRIKVRYVLQNVNYILNLRKKNNILLLRYKKILYNIFEKEVEGLC